MAKLFYEKRKNVWYHAKNIYYSTKKNNFVEKYSFQILISTLEKSIIQFRLKK